MTLNKDKSNSLIENEQIKKITFSNNNFVYVYKSNQSKFSWLGNWLEKESKIFKNEVDKKISNKPNFRRGEVIKADFGVNIGSELSNTHFAIVLNSDDNNSVDNVTVLPLTSKKGYKRIYLGNVLKMIENSNKYNKNTYALLTQITTISKKRIIRNNRKCFCNNEIMEKINQEIVNYLTK